LKLQGGQEKSSVKARHSALSDFLLVLIYENILQHADQHFRYSVYLSTMLHILSVALLLFEVIKN